MGGGRTRARTECPARSPIELFSEISRDRHVSENNWLVIRTSNPSPPESALDCGKRNFGAQRRMERKPQTAARSGAETNLKSHGPLQLAAFWPETAVFRDEKDWVVGL